MNNVNENSHQYYNETLSETDPEGNLPPHPEVVPVSPASDQPEDNNHNVTTPPPPYSSINPASDILVGATTGNEFQTSHSLYRDPPPSYNSLFKDLETRNSDQASSQEGQIENNHSSPVTPQQRQRQTITKSLTKAAGLGFICLVFSFLLPLTMISIGVVHVKECPVEPRLPVFLIVGGVLQVLECGWIVLNHTYESRVRNQRKRRDPWLVLMVVWLFLGSLWVYRTIPAYEKDEVHQYCDPLLFRFTLWLITSYYITFGLILSFAFAYMFYQFCIRLLGTTPAN